MEERMLLRLIETPRIEDLGNHSKETVETLRWLLRNGAPARRDPRREGFYEVENCSRVFYIHITPRAAVWLLAIWAEDPARLEEEGREAGASLSVTGQGRSGVGAASFVPTAFASAR